MRVAHPGAQVAGERLPGLVPVRDRPRPSAFAEHHDDIGLQVDGIDGQADHLGAAHAAGLEHQPYQRGVAQLEELAALADVEQLRTSSIGTTGTGFSGMLGGRIVAIGLSSRSPSRTAQA